MSLLNWTPEKGEPYKIPSERFEFEKANWRILNSKEAKKVSKYFNTERKILEHLRVNLHCYIWTFLIIQDPTITRMISDTKGKTELESIDKELTTYIDYPMNKTIEVKIPLLKWKNSGILEQCVGHIMWQISKVYEEIYKDHWKEVGIYGHDIGDLAFGDMIIDENNVLELCIES